MSIPASRAGAPAGVPVRAGGEPGATVVVAVPAMALYVDKLAQSVTRKRRLAATSVKLDWEQQFASRFGVHRK